MHADSQLQLPQPPGAQEKAISVAENLPGAGTKALTAVQFDARPLPAKGDTAQNNEAYVLAKGTKHVLPTLTTTFKTFDLNYKEPFKIRIPHIIVSEPSSITATLHISVEPLTGSSTDDLPQVRVGNTGILQIPIMKYWDADLPVRQGMLASPNSPYENNRPPLPGVSPFNENRVPAEPAKPCCDYRCCKFLTHSCRRENMNAELLYTFNGVLNIILILLLSILVFYGLPLAKAEHTNKMVALTAWSQLTSHVFLYGYRLYNFKDVLGKTS